MLVLAGLTRWGSTYDMLERFLEPVVWAAVHKIGGEDVSEGGEDVSEGGEDVRVQERVRSNHTDIPDNTAATACSRFVSS